MERAICEQCGHSQPGDWVAGHLCVACGAPVRREVRCAWCAEWVPSVRFCRTCGCEVVGPEQYGPARMLKSAGVDRFTLVQRLRELDPEQAANLARIYNAQLAVVARRVEELRLCEHYLLQKGFSKRLEEELVPQLPAEKEKLAALAAGPEGPFDARPEALSDIARLSPIPLTRTLASIALVRIGQFKGTYDDACTALTSDDAELALEAALAFPHWRMRLSPYELWWSGHAYTFGRATGIDRRRLAEVAGAVPHGSPLRPWAAAAVTLAWCGEYGVAPEPGSSGEPEPPDWLRAELRAGLSSRDPDLRFTCAMALGEDELVAPALDSGDAARTLVARTFLAKRKSPAIAPLLSGGPNEIRAEILENLWSPLPDALVEPVLEAVERGRPEDRARGVRLLRENLTERIVERLVHIARNEGDAAVFKVLLESERLPATRNVVRAIIRAGLFEALSGSLSDAPEYVDFTDEAVLKFAAEGDASVLERLISISEKQAERRPENAAALVRFLTRTAFSNAPAEIRCSAYRVLDTHDRRRWDWLSPSGIRTLFGDAAGFLKAASPVFNDNDLAPMSGNLLEKLSERWTELEETLTKDRAALKHLVNALRETASGDTPWRSESARLLVKVAVSCPGEALPVVAALLRESGRRWEYRDVPADLLAGYDALARRIGREEPLAAKLADALIALLDDLTIEQRYIPIIELLTRLAQDRPTLRKAIAEGTAPILRDREYGDRDLKPALDHLAATVGFEEKPEEQIAEEPPPPPPLRPEVLDHLVMLPDAPLKTLAEYVAFLKAMNTATDPMAVMTRHGMTTNSFTECMSLWGNLICSNNEIAHRYGQLVSGL